MAIHLPGWLREFVDIDTAQLRANGARSRDRDEDNDCYPPHPRPP
jgi:hypothetical protein